MATIAKPVREGIRGPNIASADVQLPAVKDYEQVDREIKDSERRRVESGAQLMQRIASLDTAGQGLHTHLGVDH